jgi:cbb3-type cytochrome c oxidase subunit III
MTPERREVIGAVVVVGLALTAVGIVGLALATLIAEGFSARAAALQPGGDQGAATPGRLLYQQFCARCHGAQAQGRAFAPPLANVGLSREECEMVVREGIPPLMPAFGKRLRTDQIQAVADYVASLNGASGSGAARDQGVPLGKSRQPGGDQQLVTSGRFVFRRQCAGCHGAQAEGRGSAPPLANVGLSREEVATAVREGIPPLMPAFAKQLPPDQIQAVADYVASLNGASGSGAAPDGGVAGASVRQPGTSRGRMRGTGCPCMAR